MIYAFIGKQRSGKTVRMTHYVLKALRQGRVVYANYYINWNPDAPMPWYRFILHKLGIWKYKRYPKTNLRRFKNWDDVLNVAGCVIALDEGWQYFDSYQKLSIDKRMRLYQSGKWEIDYMYTVQRYKMTDINLRWSTDEFWYSTLYKIPFLSYPLIIYRLYDLNEDEDSATLDRKGIDAKGNIVDLAIKKVWWFTRKKHFDVYDTKEDIYATEDLRATLQEKVDTRTADTAGVIDSTPTIWMDVKSLVKGKKYDDRRLTRKTRKRKSNRIAGRTVPIQEQRSVVERIPSRSVHRPTNIHSVDGIRL
jgi:hypothetical protein